MIILRPTRVTCSGCGTPLDRAELPSLQCETCGLWPLCRACGVRHEECRPSSDNPLKDNLDGS